MVQPMYTRGLMKAKTTTDKNLHIRLDGEIFSRVAEFRHESRLETVKEAIEELLRRALGMKKKTGM